MLIFPVVPEIAERLAVNGSGHLLGLYLNIAFLQGYRTAIAEATGDASELTDGENTAKMMDAFIAFSEAANKLYEEDREAYKELFGDFLYDRKAPLPPHKNHA